MFFSFCDRKANHINKTFHYSPIIENHILNILLLQYISKLKKYTNVIHFTRSVVSDSSQLHGLQHIRLPCASSTSGVCSNSCPSSWWCPPTISPAVVLFFSCHQSFPASGSFPRNQFLASGDQKIGVSASASVLTMNIQNWLPLGWTVGSPCSPRDSQGSSPTPKFKRISSLMLIFLYGSTLTSIHEYWKNHNFD